MRWPFIKNKNNILILYDVTLNEEGLIIEKNYFLDEVFISIPIETVITNNNTPIIKEMCQFYHCNLIVV